MFGLHVFVVSMLVLYGSHSSSGADFAQYSQTEIIENNCVGSHILSTFLPSKINCARLCSEKRECRRYLYCSSHSSCKLYEDGTDCVVSGDSSTCTCFRKNIGCHGSDCTCPLGFYGNQCQHVIKGCREGYLNGMGDNLEELKALTYIKPLPKVKPYEILCLLGYGGAWYFLSRKAECSHDTFNRSLSEYEQGFGKTRNNYWLGFNKIEDIMAFDNYQIQVHLRTNTIRCFANFLNFRLGNKASGYTFSSTGAQHSGALPYCGDSMLSSISLAGQKFSTYDVDHTGTYRCAGKLGGGWWFANRSDCARSFLTGSMSSSQNDVFWLDVLAGEIIQMVTIAIWKQ